VGPGVSHAQRMSFLRFSAQFLYHTLWLGDAAADARGAVMCRLARANRASYLSAQARLDVPMAGHSRGFLAVHRELKGAEAAVAECREAGEEASLVPWEEAVREVPRLGRLPFGPLFVVRRVDDHTASCEQFARHLMEESKAGGVQYVPGIVDRLEVVRGEKNENTFRVTTKDNVYHEFDLLILAGGERTPLLAAQLGVGEYCPTYPLRGFSMTLHCPDPAESTKPGNLLQQPFSVDSMYCTSVTPHMARMAGFGEFVGYREKSEAFPSQAPRILSRYAQKLFPDAEDCGPERAQACYRPVSPDDIPLVGEVPSLPGLFLHTGHGTLGWTVGLATGECVAQAVVDKVGGRLIPQDAVFNLADGTTIERSVLSPGRFAHAASI